MKKSGLLFLVLSAVGGSAQAALPYMEPGTLRISNELQFENILHATRPRWTVQDQGVNKVYSRSADENPPWKAEWGQRLYTDVAAQISESMRGRFLLEVQGEYADRFWRPINYEHRASRRSEHVFFREAEGKIEKENWYLSGFSGVEHADWRGHGDFFALYPESYPKQGYMGSSAYFGIHPRRYDQNHFFNVSDRQVPRGGELGGQWRNIRGAVAYGSELTWGYNDSFFGRVTLPFRESALTVVYQDKDAPYAEDNDQRDRAVAGSWEFPFGVSNVLTLGTIFRPYRSGETYVTAESVGAGAGIQGSNWALGQSRAKDKDGLGYRARYQVEPEFWGRLWAYAIDLTYLDILAGNKEQIDLDAGTFVTSLVRFDTRFTYRRPVEGPVPFLYEGTPNNIGNVVSSPRGQESPFRVDWTNREAAFVLATFQINPSPYSSLFLYDPHQIARWNLKKQNEPHYSLSGQYRMSDYRTATDRQWYYNESGDIVYESPLSRGAFASDHPLHEFRIMGTAEWMSWSLFTGVAAGQAPATSGLAYSDITGVNKSLTEYFSLEMEISRWPFTIRGHYGSGIWGPEPHNDPFFGESFDRLWGFGGNVNITRNTTIDVDYLAARQDDEQFVAPDLGSYDEIRTVLSHRFGLELQFKE